MIATAMKFSVSETNPMKVYGLPKNVATEVSLGSIRHFPWVLTLPLVPAAVKAVFGCP